MTYGDGLIRERPSRSGTRYQAVWRSADGKQVARTFRSRAEAAKHLERQKALPLVYRGRTLDCGYRIDLLVEGLVVVEIKAVERVDRVHRAQVLSYLRLSGCKVGLLIHFNVKLVVKEGLPRIVNGCPDGSE